MTQITVEQLEEITDHAGHILFDDARSPWSLVAEALNESCAGFGISARAVYEFLDAKLYDGLPLLTAAQKQEIAEFLKDPEQYRAAEHFTRMSHFISRAVHYSCMMHGATETDQQTYRGDMLGNDKALATFLRKESLALTDEQEQRCIAQLHDAVDKAVTTVIEKIEYKPVAHDALEREALQSLRKTRTSLLHQWEKTMCDKAKTLGVSAAKFCAVAGGMHENDMKTVQLSHAEIGAIEMQIQRDHKLGNAVTTYRDVLRESRTLIAALSDLLVNGENTANHPAYNQLCRHFKEFLQDDGLAEGEMTAELQLQAVEDAVYKVHARMQGRYPSR